MEFQDHICDHRLKCRVLGKYNPDFVSALDHRFQVCLLTSVCEDQFLRHLGLGMIEDIFYRTFLYYFAVF